MQGGYFHQWIDKKKRPTHLSSRWSQLIMIDVYIYFCINLQFP